MGVGLFAIFIDFHAQAGHVGAGMAHHGIQLFCQLLFGRAGDASLRFGGLAGSGQQQGGTQAQGGRFQESSFAHTTTSCFVKFSAISHYTDEQFARQHVYNILYNVKM